MTGKAVCICYVGVIFEFNYFIIFHMHLLKVSVNSKLFLLRSHYVPHTLFYTVSGKILTIYRIFFFLIL
jgi:hypothetical protein